MNPTPGSEGEFEVSMSPATAERLRQLNDVADADGRHAEFVAALEAIDVRLRTDAINLGEELFDLRALRVTVKAAFVRPVVVEFRVYWDRRIVFIRSFRYVPPSA